MKRLDKITFLVVVVVGHILNDFLREKGGGGRAALRVSIVNFGKSTSAAGRDA